MSRTRGQHLKRIRENSCRLRHAGETWGTREASPSAPSAKMDETARLFWVDFPEHVSAKEPKQQGDVHFCERLVRPPRVLSHRLFAGVGVLVNVLGDLVGGRVISIGHVLYQPGLFELSSLAKLVGNRLRVSSDCTACCDSPDDSASF